MNLPTARTGKVLATMALGTLSCAFVTGIAAASNGTDGSNGHRGPRPVYMVNKILSGTALKHTFTLAGGTTTKSESLADPDDITLLGNDIFVGFQNGVGPQGQASSSGNLDSTVVELKQNGEPIAQWELQGKTDGVTADPQNGTVIATVNEDANSSLYTIDPTETSPADQVKHYHYSEPLPHNGGTDAISIYQGQMLISASAPGTTGAPAPEPNYPAVYSVSLNSNSLVAGITPLFDDEDSATVANVNTSDDGHSSALALTDPDSNEVVPVGARFGGDFMLTSQGDQEQIYVSEAGEPHQHLSVLSLSQSVDDTAWPTGHNGTLYSTDSANDAVDAVTGPFNDDAPMVVATPCGANSAPATCPAPSYPANYLATLNPDNGEVTPVSTPGTAYTPQGGLLFIPANGGRQGGQGNNDQ